MLMGVENSTSALRIVFGMINRRCKSTVHGLNYYVARTEAPSQKAQRVPEKNKVHIPKC